MIHASDDTPGHLARRFQQIAVAVVQERLEAIGCDLTPVQYAVLAAIEVNSGIDQARLAELVALDRASMTGVVDRLERKLLIVRGVSPTDRRARVLALTSRGQELLSMIRPTVEAAQDELLSGLTPPEAAQFMTLMRKAVAALNHRSRVATADRPK